MSTPEERRPEEVGGAGAEPGELRAGEHADTPLATRGSGDPGPVEDLAAGTAMDPDLLAEGGAVPAADARDIGDPGAPPVPLGGRDQGSSLIREGRQSDALEDVGRPEHEEERPARPGNPDPAQS